MKWTPMPFGKHYGKTLPQIMFSDPDWFFWLVEQDKLYGPVAAEAAIIERRATCILLVSRVAGSYEFEWVFDDDGRFSHVHVIDTKATANQERRYGHRTQFLDMSLLRRSKEYDKGGYKRLIRQVREILFNDDAAYLTKARREAFFNDRSNFG